VGYTPRRFARTPLYRLLLDHWDTFLAEYEEQFQHRHGALWSVIERVIPRFLDCGNPRNGFACIRCEGCGHERLLAFSCKCRGFCLFCQARRAEEWAAWLLEEQLLPVVHHHVVFTLPKMLRIHFPFDRSLLNGLSRAAYTAIFTYMGALVGEGYAPGMIVARQTFGEGEGQGASAGTLIPL
jgi:hypothetical protein